MFCSWYYEYDYGPRPKFAGMLTLRSLRCAVLTPGQGSHLQARTGWSNEGQCDDSF